MMLTRRLLVIRMPLNTIRNISVRKKRRKKTEQSRSVRLELWKVLLIILQDTTQFIGGGLNQKEFNSKSQKELRRKVDGASGTSEALKQIKSFDGISKSSGNASERVKNAYDKTIRHSSVNTFEDAVDKVSKMNPGLDKIDVEYRMKTAAGGKFNALKAVKDTEGTNNAMVALGRETRQKASQVVGKSMEERLKDYKKNQPLLKKVKRSLKKLIK